MCLFIQTSYIYTVYSPVVMFVFELEAECVCRWIRGKHAMCGQLFWLYPISLVRVHVCATSSILHCTTYPTGVHFALYIHVHVAHMCWQLSLKRDYVTVNLFSVGVRNSSLLRTVGATCSYHRVCCGIILLAKPTTTKSHCMVIVIETSVRSADSCFGLIGLCSAA